MAQELTSGYMLFWSRKLWLSIKLKSSRRYWWNIWTKIDQQSRVHIAGTWATKSMATYEGSKIKL